jgi:glycine/D-amino acid oxidase-like deaminating enzyme
MIKIEDLNNKKIAIMGAGIIGLSSAYRLVELWEQHSSLNESNHLNIDIISEHFLKDTTSDGAGGLFRPDDRFIPGVPKDLVRKWGMESFKYFNRLIFSKDGGQAGVFQVSGYQLFDDDRKDPSYKDYIYQFRHLTQDELNLFPRKFKYYT